MTDFHIRVQGWWALSTPKPAGLFSYSHEGCWSFCFSGQKSTDCPLPVPQACKLRMENNFDICHLDSRPQQAHLLFLHGLLAAFSPSHLLREALCLLRSHQTDWRLELYVHRVGVSSMVSLLFLWQARLLHPLGAPHSCWLLSDQPWALTTVGATAGPPAASSPSPPLPPQPAAL